MGEDQLGGVLVVFQTPYNADLSIDPVTLEREIDWIYNGGAQGIVMAMVSEVLRLSSEERDEVAELACRLGKTQGSVVISVGAESTPVAVRHARHAEEAGADAVMAIPPISVVLDDDQILGYYEEILSSVGVPVIVQDASAYVGRPMSIAVQAELHAPHRERVVYKPQARPIPPRLVELRMATGGKARAFEGSGGVALIETYPLGVVGTMPGADLTPAVVELWEALEADDLERARRIHEPLAALVSLADSLDAFLAVEKHLLVRQGVFRNALVRGPVGFALDEAGEQEVDEKFDELMAAVGA
ncbi:MAG: dihydrodipicolinate synthase family protein [Acidimicrobiia bacterium]